MVHDRRIGEQQLTLGVSGKLVDGNLVMYDRETDSAWLQRSGEAFEGTLAGKSLKELPADQWTLTRWDEWKTEHPKTLVLTCAHCDGTGPAVGTINELDQAQ